MGRRFSELIHNTISNYKCYKEQFSDMKNCISKYGSYPYPKYMVLPEKRLIYLEMPKVANSAIKASMLNKEFPDAFSIQQESLKYTEHSLNGKHRNFYKFTFVRNPMERVVSCYENKYHGDQKTIGINIKEYDHYLFGYIKKDKGFSNFLFRIALIPDAYKDQHFKPQYKIAYDQNGKKRVNYIGKYERLNEEYGKIAQKYNLAQLNVYNKTQRKNYMEYYNRWTVFLVYLIYRKDIQYFGYMKEYRKLFDYVRRKKKK